MQIASCCDVQVLEFIYILTRMIVLTLSNSRMLDSGSSMQSNDVLLDYLMALMLIQVADAHFELL